MRAPNGPYDGNAAGQAQRRVCRAPAVCREPPRSLRHPDDIETGEFGHDKIDAMHEAFVNVFAVLKISERAGGLTEQVALKIVELARSGESDPTQLTRRALQVFNSS